MRTKMLLLMLLLQVALRAVAQTGEITGIVTDDKGEPIINATVQVLDGKTEKGGAATDFDGLYVIKPLDAGHYSVKVTYIGFKDNITTNVLVAAGNTTTVNIKMTPSSTSIKEVTVKAYKVPLIDAYSAGSTTTITSSRIEKMPTRSTSDIAATAPGVYQQKNGTSLSIAGARTSGTLYVIDGVQAQGHTIPVQDALAPKAQFYDPSTAEYKKNPENDFMNVRVNPLSTMSVDVDRASYSNVRRFINEGSLPPADAVRIEEMVNYFDYKYAQPEGADPIAIHTEMTNCPWRAENRVLHVAIQAKNMALDKLPPSNLVFLIDVSGSMESPERLPLIKAGMKLLVAKLRPNDKVSIVTYAGNAGLALPPTPGNEKEKIIRVLDRLEAGGSTAGGAGIQLAYKIAQENFIKGGNNRVLLATDGDFNVGISNDNELEDMITKERESGVFLTCLGVGTDNFKDAKMEMLADKGNGNYDYLDNIQEAEKTLVNEFSGTLFTIAKDVKAQIEFNPSKVQAYRLIGYEDRLLNEEDFKDDKKDAGDMGAGHTVTILYEIIPAGVKSEFVRDVNNLKYQVPATTTATYGDEMATIKFRYKKPDGNKSTEIVHPIADRTIDIENATEDTRFSESVAMFGMLLKDSKYKGSSEYKEVIAMAENSKSYDKDGYRAEFVRLVKAAKEYSRKTAAK